MPKNGKTGLFGKPGAVLAATAGLAIILPSAGLALPNLSPVTDFAAGAADDISFDHFTPAAVDPALARRLSEQLKTLGTAARFTPARYTPVSTGQNKRKTVTVAIRVDDRAALSIARRPVISPSSIGSRNPAAPKKVATSIGTTRFDLGAARGYRGFAKPAPILPAGLRANPLPANIDYKLSDAKTKNGKPSRFQPRISIEKDVNPGSTPRTFESAGDQSLDVGGSYRVTRNLDVTAGVRLSQERDRLDPLTDNVQDNQAVYVGTQLRF